MITKNTNTNTLSVGDYTTDNNHVIRIIGGRKVWCVSRGLNNLGTIPGNVDDVNILITEDYPNIGSGIEPGDSQEDFNSTLVDILLNLPTSSGGKFIDGDDPNNAVYLDGNVGLGITNPVAPLQFRQQAEDKIIFYKGSGTQNIGIGVGAMAFNFYTDSANTDIYFKSGGSSGSTIMKIEGTGNVGIGTTAPTEKVDIAGSAKVRDTLIVGRNWVTSLGGELSHFLEIQTQRYQNSNPDNVPAGGISMRYGNLSFKTGGTVGQGGGGAVGSLGNAKIRSITGIGADTQLPWTGYDLNTLFNSALYGQTSLSITGYYYGSKLVEKGYLNAHPDMYGTSFITVTPDKGYMGKMQLGFDQKGQLFARGSGGHSDPSWKKFISESTFQPATLQNGWVDFPPFRSPQFKKQGKTVSVTGVVKNGTLHVPIFTLPEGFRPNQRIIVNCITQDVINNIQQGAIMDVTDLGDIRLRGGFNGMVSLEFSFEID